MNSYLSLLINTAQAQGDLIPCPDGTMADPSIGCVSTPGNVVNPESSIVQILMNAASTLMSLVIGVAVIIIIYGGIVYATAGGDETKTNKAKRVLFWGAFGLIVAILAKYVAIFVAGLVS
jgi:hypothetical protein